MPKRTPEPPEPTPLRDLTSDEAIAHLFDQQVVEAVREALADEDSEDE